MYPTVRICALAAMVGWLTQAKYVFSLPVTQLCGHHINLANLKNRGSWLGLIKGITSALLCLSACPVWWAGLTSLTAQLSATAASTSGHPFSGGSLVSPGGWPQTIPLVLSALSPLADSTIYLPELFHSAARFCYPALRSCYLEFLFFDKYLVKIFLFWWKKKKKKKSEGNP